MNGVHLCELLQPIIDQEQFFLEILGGKRGKGCNKNIYIWKEYGAYLIVNYKEKTITTSSLLKSTLEISITPEFMNKHIRFDDNLVPPESLNFNKRIMKKMKYDENIEWQRNEIERENSYIIYFIQKARFYAARNRAYFACLNYDNVVYHTNQLLRVTPELTKLNIESFRYQIEYYMNYKLNMYLAVKKLNEFKKIEWNFSKNKEYYIDQLQDKINHRLETKYIQYDWKVNQLMYGVQNNIVLKFNGYKMVLKYFFTKHEKFKLLVDKSLAKKCNYCKIFLFKVINDNKCNDKKKNTKQWTTNNKKCMQCQSVFYCSKRCQKMHWNTKHRFECITKFN